MRFDNVHSDIDFNCITNEVKENTTDIFLRKLYTREISPRDFTSYWEQGRRGWNSNHSVCPREICMLKGISVLKIIKNNKDSLIQKFIEQEKNKQKFKPQSKKKCTYYCSLKFRKDAGMVWNTKRYHHTFFKCDDFDMNKFDILEVKPITSDV